MTIFCKFIRSGSKTNNSPTKRRFASRVLLKSQNDGPGNSRYLPLASTLKQYISHNCSGMKLTVLYSQWSMWKDFSKLFQKFFKTFSKYLTIHPTSLSCFDGSIVLLFSLYFLLLIIFGFCSVWDKVSVSSLVRFTYNFSVDHPFCDFSSIAATVAGLQDLDKNAAVRVNDLRFRIEAMKTAYFPHVWWPYILLNNMV